MKTIQIPEELYNDLLDIAKEYVTQDKRHQAEPCMFTVQTEDWEDCAWDRSEDVYYISEDGDKFDEDEAIEWCKEHNIFFDEDNDELINRDEEKIYKRYRRKIQTFESRGAINCFFTAKACAMYIHNDSHNLDGLRSRSYAFTPWKNFEMTTIAKLLTTLGTNNE